MGPESSDIDSTEPTPEGSTGRVGDPVDDTGTDAVAKKATGRKPKRKKAEAKLQTYICTSNYDVLKPGDTITLDPNTTNPVDRAAILGGIYRKVEDYID